MNAQKVAALLASFAVAPSALAEASFDFQLTRSSAMPTYVIERDLPGAGTLSAEQLKAIARTSNGVLRDMGPTIQWVQSYVTADKIYCVYRAADEEAIRKHAAAGGFPANRITRVSSMLDPTSGE